MNVSSGAKLRIDVKIYCCAFLYIFLHGYCHMLLLHNLNISLSFHFVNLNMKASQNLQQNAFS